MNAHGRRKTMWQEHGRYEGTVQPTKKPGQLEPPIRCSMVEPQEGAHVAVILLFGLALCMAAPLDTRSDAYTTLACLARYALLSAS